MKLDKKRKTSKSWINSKWIISLLGIVFVLMSVAFIKEILRSKKINQEIADFQKTIEDLHLENQKQANFVEYLKTDSYFEEQARIKLGMKQNGEKVIVLKNEDDSEEKEIIKKQQSAAEKDISNALKWYYYFFGM